MNSELELLQNKLAAALRAQRVADQNLEQKSLEIYNLKKDIVSMEEALRAEKDSKIDHKRASDVFMANIHEELKTPLNAILGMSHILQSSNLSKEQLNQLDLIKDSAEILKTMVTDVLDYSNDKKESFVVKNEKFDAVHFMESLQKAYALQLEGESITVQLEMDSGFEKLLLGDPGLIRKILSRIVQHARSNTREGYIYLRTRIIDRNRSRISVRFEVEDTGVGISKENIKDIYTPFQSNDIQEQGSNRGIGLAYVKKVVELLDGDMHVSSRLGSGTKYSVLLNFEETEESMLLASEEFKKRIDNIILPAPILLVEDNPLHQAYMANLFRATGNSFILAENSHQAIELARTKTFSVVFLDMHLPNMQGIELSKEIRKFENTNSKIPIVGMCASSCKGELEQLEDADLFYILNKPFHPVHVQEIFRELGAKDEEEVNIEAVYSNEVSIEENLDVNVDKTFVPEKQIEDEMHVEDIHTDVVVSKNIVIDKDYLKESYAEDPSEALQVFETYLDQTPALLNDMKYCERLSQVSSIAKKLIPSFQKVGLASFTNELNEIVELAENSQYQDLNEKVDVFVIRGNEAVDQVRAQYTQMQTEISA